MNQRDQCRMTTSAGTRCKREAERGAMGFCWQHIPQPESTKKEKWKEKLDIVALSVAATELVVKIAELALEYLPEMFGSGEPTQSQAKRALSSRFPPSYPDMGGDYTPNSRVDWVGLLRVVELAEKIQASNDVADADISDLENHFEEWFATMNQFHTNSLLNAIENESDNSA